MISIISVVVDVLSAKKINGIIQFIQGSVYLNEASSIHVSNPRDFMSKWIIANNTLFYDISFIDVQTSEFIQSIRSDDEAVKDYLIRINTALKICKMGLKCVVFSVHLDDGVRRVTLRLCQW